MPSSDLRGVESQRFFLLLPDFSHLKKASLKSMGSTFTKALQMTIFNMMNFSNGGPFTIMLFRTGNSAYADCRTREKAHNLLDIYGLKQFENARPSELSGGMRQRAALIHTLVLDQIFYCWMNHFPHWTIRPA